MNIIHFKTFLRTQMNQLKFHSDLLSDLENGCNDIYQNYPGQNKI